MLAEVTFFLPATWETWAEFSDPRFGLGRPTQVKAFEEGTSR